MTPELIERRIKLLERFVEQVDRFQWIVGRQWSQRDAPEMEKEAAAIKSALNRMIVPVKQAVEAVGVQGNVTVQPPPVVGGPVRRFNVFDNLFEEVYRRSVLDSAKAYVERALGAYEARREGLDETPMAAPQPVPGRSELKPIAFISHDSRDKDNVVRPLYNELLTLFPGERIWFDEAELVVGDSLRANIDDGLRESGCCILVLSPNYLANTGWTKSEFDSVFTRELMERTNVVLPVWVNVSTQDIYKYSSNLPDRLGAVWKGDPKATANELSKAIWKRQQQRG